MARPLRVEFAGAIYHVTARGNARQNIIADEGDFHELRDRLGRTVVRFGWDLLAFVFMHNHLHLFLRTPQPNLSKGMQYLLSGYANWFARRHKRPGHLLQGRFRADLIESENYYWEVSRYVHLNPVRTRRPLAARPEDWPWSSYRGYVRERDRLEWVAYDALLAAWQGESGGSHPARAYRRFVEAGMSTPPSNPFDAAAFGWILGSQDFVDRLRGHVAGKSPGDSVPQQRRLASLDVQQVFTGVAEAFRVTRESLSAGRGGFARSVAAWMARRLTSATLAQLAHELGLSHFGSVSNLLRAVEKERAESAALRQQLEELESRLTARPGPATPAAGSRKTKNKT